MRQIPSPTGEDDGVSIPLRPKGPIKASVSATEFIASQKRYVCVSSDECLVLMSADGGNKVHCICVLGHNTIFQPLTTHHILVPPPSFARSLNVSPTIHYATFGTDRPMSYTGIEVQPAKQTWIERKIPGAQVPEALLRTGVSEALCACPSFCATTHDHPSMYSTMTQNRANLQSD